MNCVRNMRSGEGEDREMAGGDAASGIFGCIDYFAHSVHLLAVPADLPGDFDDASPTSVARAMGLCGRLPLVEPALVGKQ